MDVLLVEGDNEKKFLEDYAREYGLGYKVIKFNIVEFKAKKIIRKIPPNTKRIFAIFDTDVVCINCSCRANLASNIRELKNRFKSIILHIQYENFEEELARSCNLRKRELLANLSEWSSATDFKGCFNALKKPIDYIENNLNIDYSILWNKVLEVKDDIDFIDANHKNFIKNFTDFKKSLKSRR